MGSPRHASRSPHYPGRRNPAIPRFVSGKIHPSRRLCATTTRSAALLASIILLWSHQPSKATTEVRANSQDNIAPGTPEQVATSGTVSDAEGDTSAFGTTDGHASASLGALRAYGSAATVPYGSSNYSHDSFNSASFRDDFLFNSPTLNGTPGSVVVRFTIEGSLDFKSSGTPLNPSIEP